MTASLAAAAAVVSTILPGGATAAAAEVEQAAAKGPYDAGEPPTPYGAITTYNNYYEFGIDKDQPARNAGNLESCS